MLWLVAVLPLGVIVALWCHLANMKTDLEGDSSICPTQGDVSAGTDTVSGSRETRYNSSYRDRCGDGATAIAMGIPSSADGNYAPRSKFHHVLSGAGQPLPTAVAVPYGTGSELARV